MVYKKQHNPEEYANLKHRVEKLRTRVELDVGPEKEAAERLLDKVEKKLKGYEETHDIPKQTTQDYNTTSSFDFWDFFWDEPEQKVNTEQKHYQNSWNPNPDFRWHVHFEEDRNYHIYKIRFKKQVDKREAFYRVCADIYEDDLRICKDITIGFWPFRWGDDRCGDMEFSSMSRDATEKYNNGCSTFYTKLLEGLMDIWNLYLELLQKRF